MPGTMHGTVQAGAGLVKMNPMADARNDAREVSPVASAFQQWLAQGEQLYTAALGEFHDLEAQLDDLETKLAAKQAEVNQIARMIGKPPVEGARRASGQMVAAEIVDVPARAPAPGGSNANIARALTGKFGR